jgi:hypothetical protein
MRVSETPYRVAPPKPPDPYLVAWADLRRRRTLALLAFFLWAPAGAIPGGLLCILTGWPWKDVGWFFALPAWLMTIFLLLRYSLFACPQCGSRLSGRGIETVIAMWKRRCPICGIRIGTPKEP